MSSLWRNTERFDFVEGTFERTASGTMLCVSWLLCFAIESYWNLSHRSTDYSCYYCGQKFILSQELSRHIRDKICRRADEEITGDEPMAHSPVEDLPIVTATSHFEVQPLTPAEISSFECATPGPSNTFADDNSIEVLEDSSYTIGDADDKGTEEDYAEKTDTATTYWGCKQCDFRYEILFMFAIQCMSICSMPYWKKKDRMLSSPGLLSWLKGICSE